MAQSSISRNLLFPQVKGQLIVNTSLITPYWLLISISPIAHINFVSALFSGSISDKEIVQKSGFLDKLNPGDIVMTGKGFNIYDLLAFRETKQSAPPVIRKNNIPFEASTATRRVATTRVHIERMIRRLKAFEITKGDLPLIYKLICLQLSK